MSDITLGIIGSGQLGSMMCQAAKKLNVKTVVISDDEQGPAQNYCDQFIYSKYDDQTKIKNFIKDSPVHLSFDVDSMDPKYIDSTGTLVERGLYTFQTKEVLKEVLKKNVVNIDICELNLEIGDEEKSLENTLELWGDVITKS